MTESDLIIEDVSTYDYGPVIVDEEPLTFLIL
jgi:hypothetical protein